MMASDLLFGWVLGLMTVILPYLGLEIYKLRRQLRFLTRPHEQKASVMKQKRGLFGWLKKSYNRNREG